VIAGPCSVESEAQFRETALAVKDGGAHMLRGGAFKPRTSPYAFQGLGLHGLQLMKRSAAEVGLPLVTEAMAPDQAASVASFADMLQIGARNMRNEPLLVAAARTGLPVLLKRGMTATVDELLAAAQRVLAAGNPRIVVCERGTRTPEPELRNSVDLVAMLEIKRRSGLPVVVDPSHGTGRTDLVEAVACAAVAAGADGVMVEVHPNPSVALSDGHQSMHLDSFGRFMASVRSVAEAVARWSP
jgi:3-deoxy-7-phosphoheptulonate synthase